MTSQAPTYDLVLLLDPQAEPDAHEKILADTRAQIAAQGELVREDDWGARALAYPIERRTDARYRLLQFHAGEPALLSELDRTLRITDGVLRFRIVKLAPGTPEPPDMRAGAGAGAGVQAGAAHAGGAHARHGESQAEAPSAPQAVEELATSEPA